MQRILFYFVREVKGATAIEYAFIAALIAVVIVTAGANVGQALMSVFGAVSAALVADAL